jgi:UDP-N-acetylglucosamine--N-acetylmuramyl-(pentapeptide) pyrophosphoryl-undecaprenol N-acetylglucosamine transferase
VYPALAVLQKLISSDKSLSQERYLPSAQLGISDVLWVGGEGGMEIDLVKRENIPMATIPAAGIHGVNVKLLPGNLWRMFRGTVAAREILNNFSPDVILFTGGYIGVPVVFGARLKIWERKRPAMLAYVPDIEPGLALKIIGRCVDQIAVTTEDSINYFPTNKNISVTGYPVRENLLGWNRKEANKVLNLATGYPTLLILGGSRGARSINMAVISVLPELLKDMQIIHITGNFDWPDVQRYKDECLTTTQTDRYHIYPYLHEEMGAALSLADIVVSRAGASALGELPLFGLPAILVPYPYAWRYQIVNAHYLSRHGAALVLEDSDINDKLLPTIQELMHDRNRMDAMGKAMRSLAHPDAAEVIGHLVCDLGSMKNRKKD